MVAVQPIEPIQMSEADYLAFEETSEITLPELGCILTLSSVYQKVKFDADENEIP